ncbi:MAG: class I SAM-dependent methyltransferase [Halanaerobiaceae bacterium]|nr:class I SAM-dependent methyltransferase [Halanaerobiaceae bacterium]
MPDLREGIDYYSKTLGLKIIWKSDTMVGLGMDDSITEVVIQNERNEQCVDIKVDYVQNMIKLDKDVKILDIGIGTGLLTEELYKKGAQIYGIDFSKKMLEIAEKKMPGGIFYLHDFRYGLPEELNEEKFDYIVSSYAIHHINLDEKIELIKELKNRLKEKGKIIIADVAFETEEKLDECRQNSGELWDDDEFYIVLEDIKDRIAELNLEMEYTQISFCAGVLVIF